jgi:alkanesulfonate monooxygenase SsuD/methylene tetrahydromethanopterin reductase-like flavin-dependent oxidoreductase (luciferase family)
MKLGVMLPSFAEDAKPSLQAAQRAEAAGLHGVFAYNHVWPIGRPGFPAIWPFPLLGAVAASTSRLVLGTLVARVGITPPDVLLGELVSLDVMSGGRFVAGVGTGDSKSREEHVAYGLPYPGAGERRAELADVVVQLVGAGVPTWVGAGSEQTRALGRRLGATVNLWAASPELVAREAPRGPVTWGGRWPGGLRAAAELITALAEAGATWAVFTWPGSAEVIADAAQQAGIVLQPAPPTVA